MLIDGLLAQNFDVMQAVEDADSPIISNAFQLGQQSRTAAIVVGEEVDVLILLTAAAPVSSKIYLLKPGKGKPADMFYSPLGFKYPNNVKNDILFLHAFDGRDSTSAIVRARAIKIRQNHRKKKLAGSCDCF
ncbi:hypothetical protein ILUMI_00180 [Ignelater luminosus]|uniref:Uncharacterized protein n=1 Tax=Ignelater luminosus TaxID=2038154 RepID=A0A8K0DKQ9_IGNLU|nr:hypothetical protein ILUMI_00180 [Ignelater luminosus]